MASTGGLIREKAPFDFGSDGVFGSLLWVAVLYPFLKDFSKIQIITEKEHERRTP